MNESLLNRILKDHKRRTRSLALILCLSMIVSLGTFAGFHKTAIAKVYTREVLDCPYTHEGAEPVAHVHNDDCYEGETLVCTLPERDAHMHDDTCYAESRMLSCGLEENPGHQHSEACFDENGELICQIPEGEGAHVHTDDCYTIERALICNQPELPVHVHDAGCFRTEEITVDEPEETAASEQVVSTVPEMPVSDPDADLETADDWNREFENLEFSGNWARDLVLVAATQQGRGESPNNFEAVLNDAGDAWVRHGYTRYGAWYGYPYAEWDAMFVSFCLRYAGIPVENVPNNPTAAFMAESFSMGGLFAGRDYVPVVGDLIFFDTVVDDDIVNIDHMGIVYHVDAEDGTINTVEGDRTDIVTTFGYYLNDEQIVGYGILPQNPNYVPNEGENTDITDEAFDGFIFMTTDEEEEPEETPTAEEAPVPEVPMPAQSWERTAGGIKVSVEAPEGAFPENTKIAVTPVNGSSLKDTVSDAVDGAVLEVQAVDITFFDAEGREIEPAVPIRVTMTPAATEHAEEKTSVVHVDIAQQTAELIEQAVGTETDNSEVVFDAEAFTIYAIVYTVDFEYGVNGKLFSSSMPGAEDMPLSEIVKGLGIVGEEELETFVSKIASVTSTNEEVAVVTEDRSVRVLKDGDAQIVITMQDGAAFSITVEAEGETSIETDHAVISTVGDLYLPEEVSAYTEVLNDEQGESAIAAVQEEVKAAAEDPVEDTDIEAAKETAFQVFDIGMDNLNTENYQEGFQVSLILPETIIGRDFRLYHLHDGVVEELELNKEGRELADGAELLSSVSFVTPSFSMFVLSYTVDFHYALNGKTYEYSLAGGSAVSFRELVETLHILENEQIAESYYDADEFINNIDSIVFSDESLVRAVPITEGITASALKEKWNFDGEYSPELTKAQIEEMNSKVFYPADWALVSLKPFNSEEILTINMKTGEHFQIRVTDAQIARDFITSGGDTYSITVIYNDDAEIPEGANLNVREILPQDEEFAEYYRKATSAVEGKTDNENGASRLETENFMLDQYARFFDIEIQADEQKIEPKAGVTVKIELTDALEEWKNELRIVHFEGNEETPIVIEADIETTDDIRFEAESFSTYGIIRNPNTTQFNGDVSDLVGKGFIISHNGQYFTSDVITGNHPAFTGYTNNKSDASIWYIRQVNNGQNFVLYTYGSDGQIKELSFENGDGYPDSTSIQLGAVNTGNWFSISKINSNTYLFHGHINGSESYYLNHWGGNQGLAGYKNSANNNQLTLETPVYPAENNKNYFIVLKQGDTYYLVLNDGRLEPVTVNAEGKFEAETEPMMWKYSVENDGTYLTHESYARTINEGLKYAESYYYSYINPNSENGFTDPLVIPPFDPDNVEEGQDINSARNEFNNILAANDLENATRKEQSKIVVQNIGNESYRIRSAINNYYIGIDGTGKNAKMVGQVSRDNSAEVFFAELDQFVPVTGWAGDWARRNMVNHIDIGISATAELHIPLAPQTYYDINGNEIAITNPTMLRVVQEVPINAQDIKNAKLLAFKYGENGEKEELDNAYYITGYSGNASTSISAAQVRIEGQFKVSTVEDVPDTCHNPYDGPNEDYRKARLDNRVYYNIVIQKEVTFELKAEDGTKMYNGEGEPLTVTVPVELSASFNYWSINNECPGLREGLVASGEYFTDTVQGPEWWSGGERVTYLGWLGTDGLPQGVIPWESGGTSGMDFILGGNKDQAAVVVTKFIEDEEGNLITLSSTNTSQFEILQKDIDTNNPISETDIVKDKYLAKEEQDNSFTSATGPYDSSYKPFGGERTITISTDGVGTVYDYDIPAGMVGVRETDYPKTVIGSDDSEWVYDHTYLRTDYVKRTGDEPKDQYHTTKDYADQDEKISVPEVLGPYHMANGTEEDSEFLEFYIHNVYRKATPTIAVSKTWDGGEPQNLRGITFDLLKNGELYGTYTLLKENHWKLTLDELEWPGEYTVSEHSIDGYEQVSIVYTDAAGNTQQSLSDSGSVLITNRKSTPDPDSTSISVQKKWYDGNSEITDEKQLKDLTAKVQLVRYRAAAQTTVHFLHVDGLTWTKQPQTLDVPRAAGVKVRFQTAGHVQGGTLREIDQTKRADLLTFEEVFSGTDNTVTLNTTGLSDIYIVTRYGNPPTILSAELVDGSSSGGAQLDTTFNDVVVKELNYNNYWSTTFDNLPAGEDKSGVHYTYSYGVREVENPEGFAFSSYSTGVDETEASAEIRASLPADSIIVNNKKTNPGTLTLTKASDYVGSDAESKIYKIALKNSHGKYMNLDGTVAEGNEPVWVEFTASAPNNTKTWSDLTTGKYTIEEDASAAVEGKAWTWTIQGTEGVLVQDRTITVKEDDGNSPTTATVRNSYTEPTDVSLVKTWDSNVTEGMAWEATFVLEELEYPYDTNYNPVTAHDDADHNGTWKEVSPRVEFTVSSSNSGQISELSNLPKFRTKEDGKTYILMYSVTEIGYKVWANTDKTGEPVYQWAVGEGYQGDVHFTPEYVEDADEYTNYTIEIINSKKNETENIFIDFDLKKVWAPEGDSALTDDAYAIFQLKRMSHQEFKNMNDPEVDYSRFVTVRIIDAAGREISSCEIEKNAYIKLQAGFKSGIDGVGTVQFENLDGSTGHVLIENGSALASQALVSSQPFRIDSDATFQCISGENYLADGIFGVVISDRCDGAPTADTDDEAFNGQNLRFRVDRNTGHIVSYSDGMITDVTSGATPWRLDFHNFPQTMVDTGTVRQTTTVYGYYFEEVESSPNWKASFYQADATGNKTGVVNGDSHNRIYFDDHVVAENKKPHLTIKKYWESLLQSEMPNVVMEIKQVTSDGNNINVNSDSPTYKYIILTAENNFEYDMYNFPVRNNQNSYYAYVPVELGITASKPGDDGVAADGTIEDINKVTYVALDSTKFDTPTYILAKDGDEINYVRIKADSLDRQEVQNFDQGIKQAVVSTGTGTVCLVNNPKKFEPQMDIRKRWHKFTDAGGMTTESDYDGAYFTVMIVQIVKDAVTGKEVKRQDYGTEFEWHYNGNESFHYYDKGHEGNISIDYHNGTWHVTIHEGNGHDGSNLPIYGYYTDSNGVKHLAEYDYTFREVSITSTDGYHWAVSDHIQDSSQQGSSGHQFFLDNYPDADLKIVKHWPNKPEKEGTTAVYFKITDGDGNNVLKDIAEKKRYREHQLNPADLVEYNEEWCLVVKGSTTSTDDWIGYIDHLDLFDFSETVFGDGSLPAGALAGKEMSYNVVEVAAVRNGQTVPSSELYIPYYQVTTRGTKGSIRSSATGIQLGMNVQDEDGNWYLQPTIVEVTNNSTTDLEVEKRFYEKENDRKPVQVNPSEMTEWISEDGTLISRIDYVVKVDTYLTETGEGSESSSEEPVEEMSGYLTEGWKTGGSLAEDIQDAAVFSLDITAEAKTETSGVYWSSKPEVLQGLPSAKMVAVEGGEPRVYRYVYTIVEKGVYAGDNEVTAFSPGLDYDSNKGVWKLSNIRTEDKYDDFTLTKEWQAASNDAAINWPDDKTITVQVFRTKNGNNDSDFELNYTITFANKDSTTGIDVNSESHYPDGTDVPKLQYQTGTQYTYKLEKLLTKRGSDEYVYYVKETSTVAGYETKYYRVNNSGNLDDGTTDSANNGGKIINKEEALVNIEIIKIDETTRDRSQTRLAGARFRLLKYDGSAYVADENYGVVDGIEVGSSEDRLGKLSFEDLSNGEYQVVEVHTPDGYLKVMNNDIFFKIENGTVTRYDKPVSDNSRQIIPATTTEGGENKPNVVAAVSYTVATDDSVASFTVGNTPGAALPQTGGIGATLFTALGGFMTATAGAILTIRRKRKPAEG